MQIIIFCVVAFAPTKGLRLKRQPPSAMLASSYKTKWCEVVMIPRLSCEIINISVTHTCKLFNPILSKSHSARSEMQVTLPFLLVLSIIACITSPERRLFLACKCYILESFIWIR